MTTPALHPGGKIPLDAPPPPPLRATAIAVLCSVASLVFIATIPSAARQAPVGARAMALTFDDLPFVAAGESYFPAAARTTSDLLRTLKQHQAPAIGFVNEGQLDAGGPRRRDREALLQQWIDAGMTLGNHTYGHTDFNAVTIEAFEDDITRGEPTITRLMAGRADRLFFRHPMTHTGETADKKEAVEAFLAARGYRIAPHTIENSDFIFDVVYVNAVAANDRDLSQRVRDAYLDLTIAATEFAERASRTIFAREIPQTLLLHANALTAERLETLLARFEARGYRFVTLDQAMADAAYATPDKMVSPQGPTWLWRWARTLNVRVSPAGDPDVPAWVLDAYDRIRRRPGVHRRRITGSRRPVGARRLPRCPPSMHTSLGSPAPIASHRDGPRHTTATASRRSG